jgi:formylglycine-generating enzyme required for sulfatase activity
MWIVRRSQPFPDLGAIDSYEDGHATTAPVGTFPASASGLYDLGGNVWEWCEDFYDGQSGARVLRGGLWFILGRDYLLSSGRNNRSADARGVIFGFRLVLVGVPVR